MATVSKRKYVKSPATTRLRELGVTLGDVASAHDVSVSAVSRWLSGGNPIPSDLRATIATLTSSRKAKEVIDLIPSP